MSACLLYSPFSNFAFVSIIWFQWYTTQPSKLVTGEEVFMVGKLEQLLEWLKPVMAMAVFEIAIGGVNILYKLATKDGMIVKIMIAYRMLFAAVSMVPLALIGEW